MNELILKKKVYRVGDSVRVKCMIDNTVFEGRLVNVMASQIFVQGEDTEKFFFLKNITMEHIE